MNEPTPTEVATIACAVEGATLEEFVASLPSELVAPYLARLLDARTNLNALTKGLESRLVADGQTGQHWTIGGTEYAFYGSVQKGYKDMPGLFEQLIACGISPVTLAGAVSDARVTDLRESANRIIDEEKRVTALAAIEEHRVAKGERGAPTFKVVDEKYTK